MNNESIEKELYRKYVKNKWVRVLSYKYKQVEVDLLQVIHCKIDKNLLSMVIPKIT